MKDRLGPFSQLRIFCQNVNRNYGYMDTLLASLYDEYDLLFIQEPPWRLIRSAPSSASHDGEDVIGHPNSPNWGSIHRPSGLDNPPRVLVYFNTRIAALRPTYRRDLIDHRHILLFSLGLGKAPRSTQTPITQMCRDFNIRHASWDPLGPEVCVHADRLIAVADALDLTLSTPVEEGPTHFPFNEDLTPTVIDLMFVPFMISLTTEHEILSEMRGTSDHAPLVVTLPGPDSEVPVTRWTIVPGSDEESAYRGDVLTALGSLSMWRGDTAQEVDEVTEAISFAFSKAWDSHAKESRWGKHSKGWWTQECSDALEVYRTDRADDD